MLKLNGLKYLTSLLMSIIIGLLPVVEPLHIVFADHDHVYCQEHQRFEDVQRTKANKNKSKEYSNRKSNALILDYYNNTKHLNCAISGQFKSISLLRIVDNLDQSFHLEAATQSFHKDLKHPSMKVLSLAPKNSPPKCS